jgi:hypothetical protein
MALGEMVPGRSRHKAGIYQLNDKKLDPDMDARDRLNAYKFTNFHIYAYGTVAHG